MNENAARIAWTGAGVRLPRRLTTPRALRLAVTRALATPAIATRAHELAQWMREHDPPTTAARLVEDLARGQRAGRGQDRDSRARDTHGSRARDNRGSRARDASEALGVGLEPTTLRLTAECSAD
jgi:hypothetical protein